MRNNYGNNVNKIALREISSFENNTASITSKDDEGLKLFRNVKITFLSLEVI